jgi:rRNA processing protein Gar1
MIKLRRIGSVTHISRSGFIVAKVEPDNLPEIGSDVFTNRAEVIGNVYDIIGSTKTPFALIKPKDKNLEKIIDKELFVGYAHAGNRKGKGSRKKGNRKGSRKRRDT